MAMRWERLTVSESNALVAFEIGGAPPLHLSSSADKTGRIPMNSPVFDIEAGREERQYGKDC
jgi:hypothetical protein